MISDETEVTNVGINILGGKYIEFNTIEVGGIKYSRCSISTRDPFLKEGDKIKIGLRSGIIPYPIKGDSETQIPEPQLNPDVLDEFKKFYQYVKGTIETLEEQIDSDSYQTIQQDLFQVGDYLKRQK